MAEENKIWMQQCDAARNIKEEFGIEKALGYLIGEKFINFLRARITHPDFFTEQDQKEFILEIRLIFSLLEIRDYLENVRRVGALGHVMSDEEYEIFREADAVANDPVEGAEIILLVDKAKELLLGS